MEKISADTNALNWFEVPVTDTARAKKFYESILDITMDQTEMMGMDMVFFPSSQEPNGKVSGALVRGEGYTPSANGAVIYLNANPDIQTVVERIGPAGGQILMPKTHISEDIGYMAFFIDTEGNKMALHAGA